MSVRWMLIFANHCSSVQPLTPYNPSLSSENLARDIIARTNMPPAFLRLQQTYRELHSLNKLMLTRGRKLEILQREPSRVIACERQLDCLSLQLYTLCWLRWFLSKFLQLIIIDIIEYILKRKWRWAGHIARMKDSRWPKHYTEWQPRRG